MKCRWASGTINAVEFIRRFLLHSLPTDLVRIRHYKFLANRNRKAHLSAVGVLLGLAPVSPSAPASVEELMVLLTGTDLTACPCWHRGKMLFLAEIPITGPERQTVKRLAPVSASLSSRYFKTTAELRPDGEKYCQRPVALPSNTAHLEVLTLSMASKRIDHKLKMHLSERLKSLCPHTIPIQNNLANTSARRLRTSPFYQ